MDGALVRLEVLARDPDATRWLGGALGSAAREVGRPLLVELSGPIGAGKTTLAQGIGAGLGIAERITSPTFALVHEHVSSTGGPAFVHADLYRIEGDGAVRELALDEWLESGAIVAVEWPERAGNSLSEPAEAFIAVAIEALDGAPDPEGDSRPHRRPSTAGSEPSERAPRRIRFAALGAVARAVVDRMALAIDDAGAAAGVQRVEPPA